MIDTLAPQTTPPPRVQAPVPLHLGDVIEMWLVTMSAFGLWDLS